MVNFHQPTLHVFAKFKAKPKGDVELRAEMEKGGEIFQTLPLDSPVPAGTAPDDHGTTARMAAAFDIRTMEDREAITALGVKYQLMSPFTNYLAIDVKAESEKAKDLPALRKTPQMLAAGWGGSGTVIENMASLDREECYSLSEPVFSRRKMTHSSEPLEMFVAERIQDLDRQNLDGFVERLNRLQAGLFTPFADIASISDLEARGVPEELVEALTQIVRAGIEEETVVLLFLYLLSQHKRFKQRLDRSTKRILAKAYKQLSGIPAEDQHRIKTAVEKCIDSIGS